ncbi:MAG: hypothetical protein ABI779_09750 [Acidobacteriota bacterium]
MNISNRWRSTVVALLAGAVGIPALGFWLWTRTPNYGVRQIGFAIETHDIQKFRKYVDLDAVSADIFTLVQVTNESGGLAGAVALTMSSSFQETLRRTITTAVESEEAGPPGIVVEFIERNRKYAGIEYVRRNGKIATVGLRFAAPDETEPLVYEIRMRDLGSHWQVAGLNVEQILLMKTKRDVAMSARLADERERQLRAAKEQEEAATLKRETAARRAVDHLGLSLTTTSVVGGGEGWAIGSVTIGELAPAGGIPITMSSSSSAAFVEPLVMIPAGESSENFAVSTTAVDEPVQVAINAEAHGVTRRVSLLVSPRPMREYLVYDPVYFDETARAYHVATCPSARGRKLFTSYQAMIVQRIPRATDCARLQAPSTTRKYP